MTLQEKIITKFQSLSPRPTLKEASLKTGIQMTRLHRILHGHEMKLEEYEVINKYLLGQKQNTFQQLNESVDKWIGLIQRVQLGLGVDELRKIEGLCETKLREAKLKLI